MEVTNINVHNGLVKITSDQLRNLGSCHTDSPKATGKHIKTNKEISPMAANPKRFTDAAQVEKWFKRNCNDVLGRACSTQEKGDFISYILSVK